MATHQMRLNPDAFELMKRGKKTREYRLFDEKRRKLALGDTIEFLKLPDLSESLAAEVEGLLVYKSWRSCYEDFWQQDFEGRYQNIDAAVAETYANWWPREKEEQYGCLIIKLRLPERWKCANHQISSEESHE